MNWLRSFVLLSFIVCALVVAALYLLYINYPGGHEYRYGFAILSIFIYWISYTALNQPVIFSIVKGHADTNNDYFTKLVVHRPAKKYSNSTLDEKEKKRICSTLDTLIKENKIYLDAELTIDLLAEKVSCSRHSLSQVLNEYKKQSFYDYINHYRVEAAKILLADEARKAYKIASIAYDAGFNSISTFNEVFKKTSGCTPSQFRRYPEEYYRRQRV
ncbi:MAG: helix-turn-helix transcriptional regulator [Ginsengibacter sp.]